MEVSRIDDKSPTEKSASEPTQNLISAQLNLQISVGVNQKKNTLAKQLAMKNQKKNLAKQLSPRKKITYGTLLLTNDDGF